MKYVVLMLSLVFIFTGCNNTTTIPIPVDTAIAYPQELEIMPEKEAAAWVNTEKGATYFEQIRTLVEAGIGYNFDSAIKIVPWQLENYILRRVFAHYSQNQIVSEQSSPYEIEYFLTKEQYEIIFKNEFECDALPIFPSSEKTLTFGSYTEKNRQLRYPQTPIATIVNYKEDSGKDVITAMITYPIETEKTMPRTTIVQYVEFIFNTGKIVSGRIIS